MRAQRQWLVASAVAMSIGIGVVPSATAAAGRAAATSSSLVAVPAASAPTLGLRQHLTEGFGHVRPRVVDYGGDPTSIVGEVRWSTWGGPHAVGHGRADWVWPGWCVACASTELPATVVAFDLGRCDGHPAYRRVEWYFPSRGMTFSPRLGTVNICDPGESTHTPQPPQAHCAPVRRPGELIDKIQALGDGVRCAGARALVATLDLGRYYRHNARFHVGRWWCGSERSMQLGGIPPQSFTCQSGDENEVWFSVTRTG